MRVPALLLPFCALLAGQGEPKGPPVRNAYQPELPRLTSRGKLAIRSVSASAPRVGRFEKLELTVDLSATFDDPFDPHEIDVRARFTSPGRESVEVHGFFYQPYRNLNDNDDGTPLLEPAGEPCWKIRFAPTEVGSHTFRVSARDRSGRVEAPQGRFLAVPSKRRGFVGVSKRNGRSFTFRDGTPVFAVGQNLQNDWPRYAHSRLLAESGCNAARVWTFCHWTWLEWTIEVAYPAAGRFVVHVGRVLHAVLEIELDGENALRVDALNVPQTDVRKSFGIDVPAGRHEITLRNVGGDWLRIGHILLTDYRDTARHPDIEVYGLHSERSAVLWFHHRLNQWAYRSIGVEPQPIAGGKATVHGLADGSYRVEWWDTYSGTVARTERRACRNGLLELALPTIRTDVACVAERTR